MSSLLDFLKSRRSIRRFKREKPHLDIVLKALDTARFAPSARNSQPWRFIIIDNRELLNKLSTIHPGAKPLESAPLAIAIVCDTNESPVSYLVDCANATIYLQLALHALGLGSVWIQTLRNIGDLRKILELPESITPVAIIAAGYPDETPSLKPRKELSEITYLNKYGVKLEST